MNDRNRIQEHNLPDFQERAASLGISIKKARSLLDCGKDYDPSTHHNWQRPKRVLADTHHMCQPSGNRWYFKYVSKGVNVSKPLTHDKEESKKLRDQLLKEHGYTKKIQSDTPCA